MLEGLSDKVRKFYEIQMCDVVCLPQTMSAMLHFSYNVTKRDSLNIINAIT